MALPKRPRHYAAEILELATLEERRAAFEKVPAALKPRVEEYVRNEWAQRPFRKPRR
ncbi:hypothetical protein [Pokkaliibacter plantistimulans]|uniref:hypothetical protein n=1 Tax=Pokkaliibacter plantistimulans TaxID=1635171 RepID=UPI0026A96597|nr:hypothetical protein [Pokkaliibacter plantistimulans]